MCGDHISAIDKYSAIFFTLFPTIALQIKYDRFTSSLQFGTDSKMRIIGFWPFVRYYLIQHDLKDCTVVIDGENQMYHIYQNSGLPFVFGCESDRYAQYIRNYLSMFIRANVKCYFIMKGGYETPEKCLEIEASENDFTRPIFMKSIFREILNEMGFEYVISEYTSKKACIAFAQKYNCPIISFDVEFCFSGTLYIPSVTFHFNETNNSISCGLFSSDTFIKTYNGLNEEKIVIFILLTDRSIFEEQIILPFFESITINPRNYNGLLRFLCKHSIQEAKIKITQFLNEEDMSMFNVAGEIIKNKITDKKFEEIPIQYLKSKNDLHITEKDPDWFAKGVACNLIATKYVNPFRWKMVYGSEAIANNEDNDPFLLSYDIYIYAYDLLTNFKKEELEYIPRQPWQSLVRGSCKSNAIARYAVEKPNYEAVESIFENGWSGIRSEKLFENFLYKILDDYHLEFIDNIPEDAKLIIIALAYISKKKSNSERKTLFPSVLLSYIMLNKVAARAEVNGHTKWEDHKNTTDNIYIVTTADCETAARLMNSYFKVTDHEIMYFNKEIIHSSVEFQHCLEELNNLNKLCGSPFIPTKYSKTFNGSFVYKVMYTIKDIFSGDGLGFVRSRLRNAITVLSLFNSLIDSFERIVGEE